LKKIEEYLKDAAECREMARIAFADHRQRLEQNGAYLGGLRRNSPAADKPADRLTMDFNCRKKCAPEFEGPGAQ
jgi:hypothetical protein